MSMLQFSPETTIGIHRAGGWRFSLDLLQFSPDETIGIHRQDAQEALETTINFKPSSPSTTAPQIGKHQASLPGNFFHPGNARIPPQLTRLIVGCFFQTTEKVQGTAKYSYARRFVANYKRQFPCSRTKTTYFITTHPSDARCKARKSHPTTQLHPLRLYEGQVGFLFPVA